MVVFTSVAAGLVINGGTDASSEAAIGTTAGGAAALRGTADAFGKAVGLSTSSGAIAGAAASKSAKGAVYGALTSGTAAVGVGSTGIGMGLLASNIASAVAGGTAAGGVGSAGIGGVLLAGGIASGPLVWLCVGAKEGTYDCWKPVVHDTSEEPSNGMFLKDLCGHPNVASVLVSPGFEPRLPHIVLENIWKEKFEIEYLLLLETNMLVCHAKPL